mgnify:FL=1
MKYAAIFILVLTFGFSFAGGYKIELKIDSAPNRKIRLANYYLGNIYARDSINLDAKGHGVFSGDTLLPQGLYKIYLDDKNHFDFLLGADQEFSLSKSSFTETETLIKGAIETEKFQEYTVFLKDMQTQGAALNKKLETAQPAEKEAIRNEIAGLTIRLHIYWLKTKEEFPNTLYSAFLLANYVPALDVKDRKSTRLNSSH